MPLILVNLGAKTWHLPNFINRYCTMLIGNDLYVLVSFFETLHNTPFAVITQFIFSYILLMSL